MLLGLMTIASWTLFVSAEDFNNDKFGQEKAIKENVPIIVLWESKMAMTAFQNCGDLKCYLSADRSLINSSDLLIILFYGTSFATDGLPLPRQVNHLWAVFHEESPKNNDCLFQNDIVTELFNYSASFKRQSHYPFPTMFLSNPDDLTDIRYLVSLKEKNRLRKEGFAPIVVVHSDCAVPSDRTNYIEMLMDRIQVDSYGQCANNKKFPEIISDRSLESKAFLKLLSQYKFILSFENHVCDDYITEKLWRAYHLGVIPIVFGSPKIKDYLVGNDTALVINDFKSIDELVERVKFLDNNDEEYNKYLQYKKTGPTNPRLEKELKERDWGVGKTHLLMVHGFTCFLCQKLHKLRELYKQHKPLPVSVVQPDHFSCPVIQKFNKQGRYEEKMEMDMLCGFSEAYATVVRSQYDAGKNASWHEIVKKAEQLFNPKILDEF